MNRLLMRLTLVIVTLLQFSATVYAGPLDDYYLQQFSETKSIQLQKAILSISLGPEPARCGMPLKHALKRDWSLLEQTTQKVLALQLGPPVLTSEATFPSSTGHFKVHYSTTGTDAPPLTDANSNGVPDWVETVAATFEDVYASYVSRGYQAAPTNAGAPYDVYLLDLAPQGLYGSTNSDQLANLANYPTNAVTSWMELDNDFTESIYDPATYSPLQSLQVTAAHEYHHAIQYGYNFYFDVWFAEATSTWMEDELYDSVNQSYSYIPAWFSNSTKSLDLAVGSDAVASGAGYGRWIFNRYLSENHTPAMIRGVWEKVGGLPSPGGDIPMVPVLESILSSPAYGTSLSADFFGFAQRVYNKDAWKDHSYDISKIHAYSPVASYTVYPANSAVVNPTPAITLPPYSFAYFKFTPTPGVPSLTITINKTSGIQTALFRKVAGVTSEIAADASGTTYVESAFGATSEVALLIANASGQDKQTASVSTDGTLVTGTGTAPPPTAPPSNFSLPSGGSSGGCFIATAAYGSYLHPQVQLLRNFRDEYLLTNAPGRAFVAFYYRCSPPLADFIARHTLLRGMTRLALTPLVVAVAHPLISAVALLLLIGALLLSQLRRSKTCSNASLSTIHNTFSRR